MKKLSKFRVVLWLLLIFTAGAVFGGSSSTRRWMRGAWAGWPSAPVEQAWRDRRIKNLRERVGLTPEQEARLAPAMDQAVNDLRQMREDAIERTGKVIAANSRAVRAELTPEQQAKFDQWLADVRARRSQK